VQVIIDYKCTSTCYVQYPFFVRKKNTFGDTAASFHRWDTASFQSDVTPVLKTGVSCIDTRQWRHATGFRSYDRLWL